jgi:hypothetical protein
MEKELDSIPNAKMGQIQSFIESMGILGGQCDRAGIAYALGVQEGSVSNPIRAAQVIGLIDINDSEVELTDKGREFLEGDETDRSRIVKEQLTGIEPFATVVRAIRGTALTEEEIMNYVKAKMVKARSWQESTKKEMFKVIRGWLEYSGLLSWNEEKQAYTGGDDTAR